MQVRTVLLSAAAAFLAFALYVRLREKTRAAPQPSTPTSVASEVDEEQKREMCTLFRLQYRIATDAELHKLPKAVRTLWNAWQCSVDESASVTITAQEVPEEVFQPTAMQRVEKVPITPENTPSSMPQCVQWMQEYDVKIGQSWGSLTVPLQQKWKILDCDVVAGAWIAANPLAMVPESVQSNVQNPATSDEAPSDLGKRCTQIMKQYNVKPGESWGSLSMQGKTTWKQLQCDVWYWQKMQMQTETPTCPPENTEAKETIAVMAGSTSRKVTQPSTKVMALFKWLLPSLTRTLDCGYKYMFVLGYDVGDPFYDTDAGIMETKQWFTKPLAAKNVRMDLRLVRVNNVLKKPGPVFLEMGRDAFNAGADYFYRVNDDTQIMQSWPKTFVSALKSLGPPYGVLGPHCAQGNVKILTHDFTHRTHMEIFEMNYYPPQLSDWWMDDWVSFVYGSKRTFKITKTKVIHHTGTHGQRYQVDPSHEQLVEGLVREGRKKIREHMLKHNMAENVLREFDADTKFGPPFKDVR